MGQYDSSAEAALTQVKAEQHDLVPARLLSVATGILTLATAATGVGAALASTGLIQSLKKLAANKDESNLIYFAEALIEDLRRLNRSNEEMRNKVNGLFDSTEFEQTVQNATLYITQTNVKSRLQRLARVIVNGAREDDLHTESLDDMMHLAVLLADRDIEVLRIVYEMQHDLFSEESLRNQRSSRTNHIMRRWQTWWTAHMAEYSGVKGLEFMNSSARLLGQGLVAQVQKSFTNSPLQDDMELLLFGKQFYEHLRDIATAEQLR